MVTVVNNLAIGDGFFHKNILRCNLVFNYSSIQIQWWIRNGLRHFFWILIMEKIFCVHVGVSWSAFIGSDANLTHQMGLFPCTRFLNIITIYLWIFPIKDGLISDLSCGLLYHGGSYRFLNSLAPLSRFSQTWF
jgi:hypothetical protein